MIGFAMCGSFCTHKKALGQLEDLRKRGYEVVPILSECVYETDTRFGNAKDLFARVTELCGREPIHTVVDAEPLGPKISLDALVICPCTGNTLAKIANGIADTLITRAAAVCIKEGRKLILMVRETPKSAIMLENELKLARLGVVILDANPGFYPKPRTVDDVVDIVVGRCLDQLGLDHDLYTRWQ